MHSDWTPLFDSEVTEPYYMELDRFIAQERQRHLVHPPESEVFAAFDTTALGDTKVVIVGQDPYHGPGQAHGLAFSVNRDVSVPPSLRNIFTELSTDLGIDTPSHGDLTCWARQGVLLLNTTLTVRTGAPGSHAGKGWERFTDRVIEEVGRSCRSCVFVLWGRAAQRKIPLIAQRHRIVSSAHPSPLSAHRGFFGSRPFSTINRHLIESAHSPIDWTVA